MFHLVRQHRKELVKPGTEQKLEYADITIEPPKDVKFYIDYHMQNVNSFFTFDTIEPKYIKDITIKEVGPLLMMMR